MRKTNLYRSLVAMLIIISNSAFAQIVITNNHMPAQGDTIRVSSATFFESQITDPAITGFDHNWDYSNLQSASQTVLSFINPAQTNFLYFLTFGPTVANLAVPVEGLDFIDLQVTDAYEFYKKSTSEYVRAGYAATIMGIPLPLRYDVPERIYKFPLSVNSVPDSSISTFEVQYPPLAYFSQYKKRVNTVDGSGILVTPYGSFNTLRIKSVIYERDSLYLDTLQMGIPIIRNIIEYRWLNPDFPVPLLTISHEGVSYSVQYIDTISQVVPITVSLGNDITVCKGETVTLTAQVEGGNQPYTYLWNNGSTTPSITVSPNVTTTYMVIACDNSGICANASVDVIIKDIEPFTLGSDTTLCAELTLNLQTTNNYDMVTWYVNNQEVGTGSAISIDSTGIGLNSAVVKVVYQKDGCVGSDEITVTYHICGGFDEIQLVQLTINPNPATENIIIQNNKGFSNPKISVQSLHGSSMFMNNFVFEGKRITLDVSKLKPGFYTISVIDNNEMAVGKFIKY